MKIIQYIFSSELIESFGWALVHSLWQGTVLAIGLVLLLLLMHRKSAQLKYFISLVVLIGFLGWSVITFVKSYNYATKKATIKENIISTPGYIKSYLNRDISEKTTAEITGNKQMNLQVVRVRSFFQRNFSIICLVWVIGMLFLSLRLVGGLLYLRRIRITNLISFGDEWIGILLELINKLQIKRKVEAFLSPLVNVPLIIGSIKPVILFPVSAFTGFTTKEIEAILAHELAHVLRHDYLFNILQSMVEILFFYHPAVWLISSRIRSERENSCDNIAIEIIGDKVTYAKALASVQEYQMGKVHLAMALAPSKGNILQRVKRIQKQVAMKTNFVEGLIAAGVIVLVFTLASFTIGAKLPSRFKSNGENSEAKVQSKKMNTLTEKKYIAKELDSLLNVTKQNISNNDELENSSEELEELIEVALSEQDDELSAEMLEEINEAIEEIRVSQIVREAMMEASMAVKEANDEIDYHQIRRDMSEAARDIEKARAEVEMELGEEIKYADGVEREGIALGLKMSKMGLDIATAVVENIPVDQIIATSLKSAEVALRSIGKVDFDSSYENDEISDEESFQFKDNHSSLEDQLDQLEKHLDE